MSFAPRTFTTGMLARAARMKQGNEWRHPFQREFKSPDCLPRRPVGQSLERFCEVQK
jgi:hypothetical protein